MSFVLAPPQPLNIIMSHEHIPFLYTDLQLECPQIFSPKNSICPTKCFCRLLDSGLMVSAVVSRSSGPSSSPGQQHCIVPLGNKTLLSQ